MATPELSNSITKVNSKKIIKEKEIPYGYCHCGCGQKTNLRPQSYKSLGVKKGEPYKYIKGHQWVGVDKSRDKNFHWKGGQYVNHSGYVMVYSPDHPYAAQNGYIRRSRCAVEKSTGFILSKNIIIHHENHIRDDDRPENLKIKSSHREHAKLHRNEIAKKECGHSDWRKCKYCHQYDSPQNMYSDKKSSSSYHLKCKNKRRMELNAIKREARASL